MNRVISCLLISSFLLINLLTFDVGMTQPIRSERTIFFSGPVREAAWDQKVIVVDNRKCFLSHDTRIVDQKGNPLKRSDIKTNSEVAIDAIALPGGYMIKVIVVITDRGV